MLRCSTIRADKCTYGGVVSKMGLQAMHDDLFVESTGCHRDADDERYVMWPSIENTDEVSFSNCSAETVHKLVHNRRHGNFRRYFGPFLARSLS